MSKLKVLIAEDGTGVLELYESWKPDMAILDKTMPEKACLKRHA